MHLIGFLIRIRMLKLSVGALSKHPLNLHNIRNPVLMACSQCHTTIHTYKFTSYKQFSYGYHIGCSFNSLYVY